MIPSLLFVVSSDPRVSGRPAEALRLAAGVGAWKKVAISLYLHGPAVLALSEFPDDLVDAENYERYLPLLREWGQAVMVQEDAPLLGELGTPALPFQPISKAQLADLAGRSQYVLRF